MKKYVYLFNEGDSGMGNILGGKGANLAEMTNLKIPVPPGFTISTEVCTYFMNTGKYPPGFKKQVSQALNHIETSINKKFGDNLNPLLLSVRSGARQSMPGMMETVLNIGLTKKTIVGLIKKTNNERFAYDSLRRLITMYADVVMEKANGLDYQIRNKLEKEFDKIKKKYHIKNDYDLTSKQLKSICENYEKIIQKQFKLSFPQNHKQQLWDSIEAVFKSWNGSRAKQYRKIENIPNHWGTAVNVQCMVFGNMGGESATGVAFTRNPSTGENVFFGEWLPNAQGEDVVAGIRTPFQITTGKNSLKIKLPGIYKQLNQIQNKLESHFKDMQDIEFTVENNVLWLLQTRKGKRNGIASLTIALDFLKQKKINEREFFNRINSDHLNEMLHPTINLKHINIKPIATGLPAGPGAAIGQIVFDADTAEKLHKKGYEVILVREETSPEDVHGMYAANAILTARGGMTSHAALVARGWGKCCIVGCKSISINLQKKICYINNRPYKEMSWFTLDGSSGTVYNEKLKLSSPSLSKNKMFIQLMNKFKKHKSMNVRTNADNPNDVKRAKDMGAEGIGLCRTEHMFFNPQRILEVRKMIISNDYKIKLKALKKLEKFQTNDFYNIFKAISPFPTTIRLLDPPLHEFLPNNKEQIKSLSLSMKIQTSELNKRIIEMKEGNPMLGHRGCRLGITFPDLTIMQTKAILNAAHKLKNENIIVKPEIMIPLVGSINEFLNQKQLIDETANELNKTFSKPIKYLVGTMIELPRACFIADKIADNADFLSFGTNDLTQTTFGFSRDDIGSFLPDYLQKNILLADPFSTLDINGVGELIKIAIIKAKKTNPKIKIGVCGEHGGDPKSISFFKKMNFDYVSCSPFRVPVAFMSIAKNNL